MRNLLRASAGSCLGIRCRGQCLLQWSTFETFYGNVVYAPGGNSSADCRRGVVTNGEVRALADA